MREGGQGCPHYYVRVDPVDTGGAQVPYRLRLAYLGAGGSSGGGGGGGGGGGSGCGTDTTGEVEPNDTAGSAYFFTIPRTLTGSVDAAGNATDFWGFSLASDSAADIELTFANGDLDLYLWESDGTTEYTSVIDSSAPKRIAEFLPAGTYYISVVAATGASSYSICVE